MLHPALIRVPHTPLAHSRPGFFGLRPHHRCTGVEAWQASGETGLRTQLRTSPRHLLLPFAPPLSAQTSPCYACAAWESYDVLWFFPRSLTCAQPGGGIAETGACSPFCALGHGSPATWTRLLAQKDDAPQGPERRGSPEHCSTSGWNLSQPGVSPPRCDWERPPHDSRADQRLPRSPIEWLG